MEFDDCYVEDLFNSTEIKDELTNSPPFRIKNDEDFEYRKNILIEIENLFGGSEESKKKVMFALNSFAKKKFSKFIH